METIKPMYDYIVFKRIDKEEKSTGGLIITNADENRNIQYSEVLAVGPGRKVDGDKLTPLQVKVGDIIICAKYGGTDIGGDRYLLKEDHVFAVIEGN